MDIGLEVGRDANLLQVLLGRQRCLLRAGEGSLVAPEGHVEAVRVAGGVQQGARLVRVVLVDQVSLLFLRQGADRA